MAPDVLVRKLSFLRQLLADLEVYRDAELVEIQQDHYVVERILELLAVVASDILAHLLAERSIQTPNYRETFLIAGEEQLIPKPLASSLAQAASMRNIIAHLYETIDYQILHATIPRALDDFAEFVLEGDRLLRDMIE